MLDAYIIERIRREQERARQRNSQRPLHIDDSPPPPRPGDRERDEPTDDRGSVTIDFHL